MSLNETLDLRAADEALLSTRLRAARERMGWTRETLAHHAGLSWAAISQIETARRTAVRAGTLVALARALGVSTDYLLGREPDGRLLTHRALVYRSDEEFSEDIVPPLRASIDAGDGVLVVTTARKIGLLRRRLGDRARAIRFETSSKWYRSPVDSLDGFRAFAVEQLAAGVPWVNVVGEPVWRAPKDEIRRWVTYEAAFNLIFKAWPLSATCLYDAASLDPSIVRDARRTHPAILSGDGLATSDLYRGPEDYLFSPKR